MRVAIVGSGGAGKSWLTREVGRLAEIEPVHLDALYYDSDWRATPPDRWAQIQRTLVEGERCIVDGNYAATMEIRLNAADTIVFLDTSTFRRIARIVGRRFARRGPARPDVIGAERLNWKFLRYVATYN